MAKSRGVDQIIKELRENNIPDNLKTIVEQLYNLNVVENIDKLTDVLHTIGKSNAGLAFKIFSYFLPATQSVGDKKQEDGIAKAKKPTNFLELIKTIQDAVTQKQTVKAVGTHHSLEWTGIGKTIGTQIDMSQLNDVVDIKRVVLKDEYKTKLDERMICCFEAGATMEHVQEYLWPLGFRTTRNPEQYRVLENQTGCGQLSLSGSIATGAHGNGLTKPIIADMVLSIHLLTVDENGQVVQKQIEPKNGITDRDVFEKHHKERQLVQNDKTFNAALVNIGGMGIAYSFILRTEKAFYLTEKRRIIPWSDAKCEIKVLYDRNRTEEVRAAGSLHSFEVFVNPYPLSRKGTAKESNVVICTLEYSDNMPNGNRPDWHIIPHEWVRQSFVWACTNIPEIVPFLIDILMSGTTTKQFVTMNAVEALDPLSGLAVSGQVRVSECAMKTETAGDVIEKIQAVIDLYRTIQKENKIQFATSPFAVRFSKSSEAYMAMQYKRQSMMIISNVLVDTPCADDTLKQFRKLMREKFNGRPHWGMIQDVDVNNIKGTNPTEEDVNRVTDFTDVMNELDPLGIFRNEFITKLFFPAT